MFAGLAGVGWLLVSGDDDGGPEVASNPAPTFAQTGPYLISEARLVAIENDRLQVVADAQWVPATPPERRGCSYVIYEAQTNDVLANEVFTLFVESGQAEAIPMAEISQGALDGATPGAVDVRCQT